MRGINRFAKMTKDPLQALEGRAMSDTDVQRFYRYQAYIYDKTRWTFLHGRRPAVERLQLRPHSQVLDVGCGTGLNFRFLQEHLDPRHSRIVGVDFSEDMLSRARRRIEDRGWPNVELIRADATAMEFASRFDAILFAYSLTMIPDFASALRRASALLASGGRLVVLDFSTFDGWGPLAPMLRRWLAWHHVQTERPYAETMRSLFHDVEWTPWLGGYGFTAVCRRPVDGSRH